MYRKTRERDNKSWRMIRVIRKTKGEDDSQNVMADTLNVYGKQ